MLPDMVSVGLTKTKPFSVSLDDLIFGFDGLDELVPVHKRRGAHPRPLCFLLERSFIEASRLVFFFCRHRAFGMRRDSQYCARHF